MEKQYKIHFLGIGGVSQSALALFFRYRGNFVSGSDICESENTRRLQSVGIPVEIAGVSSFLKDADIVVVSASIGENDKELLLAKSLNKTIVSRAKALAEFAKTFEKIICVSGTHGKTTTTGMIAKIFCDAGKNPTVHVGGSFDFLNGNFLIGGSKYFITEACEYKDGFLNFESDISVVLNVQKDHMDYFKTLENLQNSFRKFANQTKQGGLVVCNADDFSDFCNLHAKVLGVSVCGKGDFCAENINEYEPGKYEFDCVFQNENLGRVRLGVFGLHNVSNALSAICVALNENIDFCVIQQSLLNFRGAKRRFEDCGELFGTKLVLDYAHHPTEIRATIGLAKQVVCGDVFVVFQPHTYSRTKLLLDDFKTCFSLAKEVLVFKTYGAREQPQEGVDHIVLAREIEKNNPKSKAFESYVEMLKYVFPKLKPGDMLLVLGAGDIDGFLTFVKKIYQKTHEKL